MSELKAIRSGEIYNIIEYEDCYRTDDLYYPKSEADKIIAELKKTCKDKDDWCLHLTNKLRAQYELAMATIREYKNDIANLTEKLNEAQHDADNSNMA